MLFSGDQKHNFDSDYNITFNSITSLFAKNWYNVTNSIDNLNLIHYHLSCCNESQEGILNLNEFISTWQTYSIQKQNMFDLQ